MPERELRTLRSLLCDAARFVRMMGPTLASFSLIIGMVYAAIDWQWGPTINAWKAMPDRLAAIEARLGEVPELPFVEFMPSSRMWPETVRAGETVRIVYVLRRNRECDATITRQFQRVSASSIDPALSSSGQAASPPLTVGYEVFSAPVTIPENIAPGLYVYRPVLSCEGEKPVAPPVTFFEVRE